MGHVQVEHLSYALPDGRPLLSDVSLRVGDGAKAAIVGPNGAGKTTLLRLIAGDLSLAQGDVTSSGGVGVMRQFIGTVRDGCTVRDLLLSVAPDALRTAADGLARAERALAERSDEQTQLSYAQALADFGDAGGYDIEVEWDGCAFATFATGYEDVKDRLVNTLSGGEQKRLVLEALLRGDDEVLLLDEPDNYLDVPGKEWLEHQLRAAAKTILLVSHDRQLLANAADHIVTVEGGGVWIHAGGYASYAEARASRLERLARLHQDRNDERARLRQLVHELRHKAMNNDALAPAYRAAQTRLARFEATAPPERPPKRQNIRMRLRGGRTGSRVLTCDALELTGLLQPFDLQVWYGERVAILGSNGSGKSSFLELLGGLSGEPSGRVPHSGEVRLGANVEPGRFVQTHARPDLHGRRVAEIVIENHSLERNEAMQALARYELAPAGGQPFETLSGGQQARLQILLLELAGATLLLLDEPTDNLDLASADALQAGLDGFDGTVLAVTHDRWFAGSFDRFLVFGADGRVVESPEPLWRDLAPEQQLTQRDHRKGGTADVV